MSNITAREFTDSFLLSIISSPSATKNGLTQRILETAKNKVSPDGKIYEVLITVNGISVDFHDYVERIASCLDDLVMRAAEEIFDDKTKDLNEAVYDMTQRARELTRMFETQARLRFGLPPREED